MKTMKTKKIHSLLVITFFALLLSCKTHTILSQKVTLGMTKELIIQACGKPYKTSARYDNEENLQEILFYKEKTWDDGGWSWSTTVTNHLFILKNGKLVAIDQGNEEHNKQQYNTLFVW